MAVAALLRLSAPPTAVGVLRITASGALELADDTGAAAACVLALRPSALGGAWAFARFSIVVGSAVGDAGLAATVGGAAVEAYIELDLASATLLAAREDRAWPASAAGRQADYLDLRVTHRHWPTAVADGDCTLAVWCEGEGRERVDLGGCLDSPVGSVAVEATARWAHVLVPGASLRIRCADAPASAPQLRPGPIAPQRAEARVTVAGARTRNGAAG